MRLVPIIPLPIILVFAILIVALTVFCIIKKQYRHHQNFRRIGVIALLIIALLRPVINGGQAERKLNDLNVFFVVDNTGSMVAKDMNGGSKRRYEAVSEDIKKIATTLSGARFSVISLDYNVHQAAPLSTDASMIKDYAEKLLPKNSYYSQKSDLHSLLEYTSERIGTYSERHPERNSVMFLFTDGEDNTSGSTSVPQGLSNNISGGAVFGYGSKNGSKIESIDYKGEISDRYIRNKNGNDGISAINSSNLAAIAESINIPYYDRSNPDDITGNVDALVGNAMKFSGDDELTEATIDFYWVFAILAIGLILWDFAEVLYKLFLERKETK